MLKSYKVMLNPNKKQNTRLFQFAGTARFMWLCNKIEEFAERMLKDEKSRLLRYTEKTLPQHLLDA